MFNSTAIVKYDFKQDVLRAELSDDLDKYYKFLYLKNSYNINKMWTARYSSHISIYNPQFHGIKSGAKQFNNQIITFEYNPEEIFQGGFTKGFTGFYLPIKSLDIERIKTILEIVEPLTFKGLHISLFTNKHLKKQQYASQK